MKIGNYNLESIGSEASGLDAFFADQPQIVTPTGTGSPVKAAARVKVASLQQLGNFRRVSAETLIHKSTNDLWTLRKEGEDFYIERLFQEGAPLKG
jgi:hypothetical protein